MEKSARDGNLMIMFMNLSRKTCNLIQTKRVTKEIKVKERLAET